MSNKPKLGLFYKIIDQCSSKRQGHKVQGKAGKLSLTGGDMTDECAVGSWIGPQNRKKKKTGKI